MNNQLVANVHNVVIPAIAEEDREAEEIQSCAAQLEQLRCERAGAKENHHRAILDAVIENLRAQLEYAVERQRVKADIRRYESERRYGRDQRYRSP